MNGIGNHMKHFVQDKIRMLAAVPALLFIMAGSVTVPLFMQLTLPPDGSGTMDSVDIWVAPDPSQSIVFVTDKSRDCLEMHNPVSNTFIGRLGSTGTGPGELQRPNGVAVAYRVSTTSGVKDAVFTVERDNHRVSAFSLPDQNFIGSFGAADLKKPYGIAVHKNGSQLQTWITDVRSGNDRVYVYDIHAGGSGITASLNFFFDVPATLESIVIDSTNQRALICDEGSGMDVMVYDLNGNFIQRFGTGLFVDDPEGIDIYDLGNGAGYIVVSDQNASPTEFEVFDRQTFQHLGAFSGPTRGTDGIAICQFALPNLPQGSFYALHSDKYVHVYDWADIASAMNLSIHVINGATGLEREAPGLPEKSEMIRAYPNPFNPQTTIRYRVDAPAPVRLDVYDVRGRKVKSLVNRRQPAGDYSLRWNGTNAVNEPAASGIYFLRLRVGQQIVSQKVLLQK